MLLYIIRFLFVITIASFLFVGVNTYQNRPVTAQDLYDNGIKFEKDGNFEKSSEFFQQAWNADKDQEFEGKGVLYIFVIGLCAAIFVIIIDWLTPKKSINALAGVFFGLLVGVLISWAMAPEK